MTLAAVNLSFAYHPERPILRDLSAAFAPEAVTAVIGPNGAGKSTLLRCLLGTLRPQAGRVDLAGRDLAALTARERAARLAYIPQSPSLSEDFTARRVVALGRFARPSADDHGHIAAALQSANAEALADQPFNTLSAGQQQRVTLARAIAQLAGSNPGPAGQVVLADEPCSAMDPRHALHALATLQSLARRGSTVIIVLHDFAAALRYADHALLLDDAGRVRAHGPIADSLTPAALEAIFGVPFDPLPDPADPARVASLVARRA